MHTLLQVGTDKFDVHNSDPERYVHVHVLNCTPKYQVCTVSSTGVNMDKRVLTGVLICTINLVTMSESAILYLHM